MGYTNSPAEFQRCMAFILRDEMPHVANIFIDDLPIKGPASQYLDEHGNPETLPENPGIRRFIWEHANDVNRVLHRVKCAGGTFSPKKGQICRQDVVILGHTCNPEGRVPEDARVKKILNWPILTTPKEVRGFLGLCGTVRIWIKDFSLLTRPLTNLYRKGKEFKWGEEHTEAFNTLKKLVASAPALRPIDYQSDLPVILSVDTSYMAVGFILSQIDEDGKRRPARYGSLPLNERESRYSQPKLELYGLYRALRHWRLYLIGVKNLHVEVDAQYIRGMLKEPDLQPNAAINRWIQGILTFDFTLFHVPGHKFQGPDALSRRPMAEDEEIVEDDDEWLDDIALYTSFFSTSHMTSGVPFCYSNRADPDDILRDILRYLITQVPPATKSPQDLRRFVKKAGEYFIKGNTMYRRNDKELPLAVILKQQDRLDILRRAHDDLGHKGEKAVFQTVRLRFYWPHLRNDIKKFIRSCHQCQLRSVKRFHIPLTVSAPTTLFSKVYIDVMKMPKAHGFNFIVAARDDLSGACEARAIRNNNSQTLANFFWEQIYCRYGCIQQVTTDNGGETKGAFQILMRDLGIPHVRISPYNSQANGVVERGHFTLREALVKSCEGRIQDWPLKLPQAVFADRITTSSVTGYSPHYLLYGEHPLLPFDITEATFMIDGYRDGLSTSDLLALRIQHLTKHPDDLRRASEHLIKRRFASKAQFEERFHKTLRTTDFDPGDLVLIRNSRVEKNLDRKSEPRYIGPFVVIRKARKGSYILRELDGTVLNSHVAGFRLAPYIARDEDTLQELAESNPQLTRAMVKELLHEAKSDRITKLQDELEKPKPGTRHNKPRAPKVKFRTARRKSTTRASGI
jgi:transposase InsO family protein